MKRRLVNYDCRAGDVIHFEGRHLRVMSTMPNSVLLATLEDEPFQTLPVRGIPYDELKTGGAYYLAILVPIGMDGEPISQGPGHVVEAEEFDASILTSPLAGR
jgi:hypothetical protein